MISAVWGTGCSVGRGRSICLQCLGYGKDGWSCNEWLIASWGPTGLETRSCPIKCSTLDRCLVLFVCKFRVFRPGLAIYMNHLWRTIFRTYHYGLGYVSGNQMMWMWINVEADHIYHQLDAPLVSNISRHLSWFQGIIPNVCLQYLLFQYNKILFRPDIFILPFSTRSFCVGTTRPRFWFNIWTKSAR